MAAAQDTSPKPTPDPVLEAALRDASLAKARADKAAEEKREAESERDKLKAVAQPFGTPTITAPSGNVTTDALGFVETQILGQEAAKVITYRFADELAAIRPKPKSLIIFNSADVTAVASYMPILLELKQFNSELVTAHLEAVAKINSAKLALDDISQAPQMDPVTLAMAAPAIATGVVKSVAELAQLFRSTTDFKNKDVPINEDTIVSYLVDRLSGIDIYYPSLFPAGLSRFSDKTELSDEFNKIQSNKLISENDVKEIAAKIEELTKLKASLKANQEKNESNPNEVKRIKGHIDKADQRVKALEEMKVKIQFLVAASDQVIKGLETPDSTTKITPLAQLVRSAHMQKLMNTADTYTLRFSVVANGTTKIRQWLFLDAKVRHSAGARVAYQLFDKDGIIKKANSFQFYFDWKSSIEVRTCLESSCITSNEKTQNKVP